MRQRSSLVRDAFDPFPSPDHHTVWSPTVKTIYTVRNKLGLSGYLYDIRTSSSRSFVWVLPTSSYPRWCLYDRRNESPLGKPTLSIGTELSQFKIPDRYALTSHSVVTEQRLQERKAKAKARRRRSRRSRRRRRLELVSKARSAYRKFDHNFLILNLPLNLCRASFDSKQF